MMYPGARRALSSALPLIAVFFGAGCDKKNPVETNPDTTYHIEIRYYGPEAGPQTRAAFETARLRIEAMITADLPATKVNNVNLTDNNTCGVPVTVNETVDDLVIYVTAKSIDGSGRVQASSGPCLVRSNGKLPVIGKMEMDADDLTSLGNSGRLNAVVLHEMLHVVGFGTIWDQVSPARLSGAGGDDPRFTGPLAAQGCSSVGGSAICATGVPVENCVGVNQCGTGTRDSHWREATFRTELMTGFIENVNVAMPLSVITIQSFGDLGYTVNPAVADTYKIPGTAIRLADDDSYTQPIWETTRRPSLQISSDGSVEKFIAK
jgi:hypothetical protein